MDTSILLQDNIKENDEFSLIRSKIHEIRGQMVMLDFDLAERYEIETAQLKRQVRRNIERFEGEDFMFELTKSEFLRCQNGISNRGGTRYLPFAFTELGIAMLSSVLNSEKAIKVNRKIMRAFVAIRHFVLNFSKLNNKFEDFIYKTNTRLDDNDATFVEVFKVLDELVNEKIEREKPRNPIGFKQKNNKQ